MTLRRLTLLAAIALGLSAPATARATDYHDAVDDFSAHIDPPGFIACITWPLEGWDRVDCDGLSQSFEAGMRATLPRDVILTGSSVHRSDGWGFRVQVTRLPWSAPPLNETEEGPYLEGVRKAIVDQLAASKSAVEAAGVDVRMVTVGEMHAVRVAYETSADPPESFIELGILGAQATHGIQLEGPRAHAHDLDGIADRALRSVHVRPAPRHPPALLIVGAVALGLFALVGTFALLTTLVGPRQKKRASAVDWPSTRG